MSLPPRPEVPGAIWHITSRGSERHSIFVDDEDLERFLALLGKVGLGVRSQHCDIVVECAGPSGLGGRLTRQRYHGVETLCLEENGRMDTSRNDGVRNRRTSPEGVAA